MIRAIIDAIFPPTVDGALAGLKRAVEKLRKVEENAVLTVRAIDARVDELEQKRAVVREEEYRAVVARNNIEKLLGA